MVALSLSVYMPLVAIVIVIFLVTRSNWTITHSMAKLSFGLWYCCAVYITITIMCIVQVDKHCDGSIKGGLAKNIELNGNNEMFLFDKVEDKRLGNAVSWANKGKQIYAAAEIDSKQRAEKVWGCHKQAACSWNVQKKLVNHAQAMSSQVSIFLFQSKYLGQKVLAQNGLLLTGMVRKSCKGCWRPAWLHGNTGGGSWAGEALGGTD